MTDTPLEAGALEGNRHKVTGTLSAGRRADVDPADMTTPTRFPPPRFRLGAQFRFFFNHPNFDGYEWTDGVRIAFDRDTRSSIIRIIDDNDLLGTVMEALKYLLEDNPIAMERIDIIVDKYYAVHNDPKREDTELSLYTRNTSGATSYIKANRELECHKKPPLGLNSPLPWRTPAEARRAKAGGR